jgi:hypothetical protein
VTAVLFLHKDTTLASGGASMAMFHQAQSWLGN